MAIEIRSITDDQLERYMDLVQTGFGGQPEFGEAERIRQVIGLDRSMAAFDASDGTDRMIATMGAYGLRLTMPGTTPDGDGPHPPGLAAAGLTRVTVAATHRRRGVLTAMMGAHLADAEANDEPVSTLWASELSIYGRFGYGSASDAIRVSYDSRRAGITAPASPDDVVYAEGDEATEILPPLREHERLTRPGHFHRTGVWWEHRSFPDHEFMREGASPRRTVIARRQGRPVGYATFRQLPRWTDHDLPDGEIKVIEVAGLDLQARHTLWWFLSNIDLHPTVSYWSLPTDSELPWLATNQRAVIRHLTDGLQVRVLDVVTALQGRRWARPGHLTFGVADDVWPKAAGTYHLEVTDDGLGQVERTDAQPELDLQVVALGALLLGSRSARSLAAAGWIDGDQEAIDRAGRLFAWPVAAWCDEMF